MKKATKLISFILIISSLLSSISFAVDLSGVDYDDILPAERYERCYDERNYENEFEPGGLLICFKKGVTEDMDFIELLPEVKIAEVKNIFNFERVMIHVWLEERTRESVLEAIDILKVTDIVFFAEPNYRVYIDDPVEVRLLIGDMDFNSNLTNSDLIIMSQIVVGMVELFPYQDVLGDANFDGQITNEDIVIVARTIVGLEPMRYVDL